MGKGINGRELDYLFVRHREKSSKCACGNELAYRADRITCQGFYKVREYCDQCQKRRWYLYSVVWVRQRRKEFLRAGGLIDG